MVSELRELAAKSKAAIVAYQMYDNWSTKRRFKRGKIELASGSTHSKLSLIKSLEYIQEVFDDYLYYSETAIAMLRGKRILEIGPGDNVGVALKFLMAGASQVVCLDRFFSKYDQSHQRQIYQFLRGSLSEEEQAIFDEVVDLERGIKEDAQKLVYIYGTGIEEAEALFEPASFDCIVSRAVCEHLYDLDAAFSVMDRLLKPGGTMMHKVDFRDHNMFSSHGHHPLTFLTIRDAVYKLMSYDSGKPNRRLINYYRHKAAGLAYDSRILKTQVVGIEDEIIPHKEVLTVDVDYTSSTLALLASIRPHLQPEFRDMSDEDLMVAGIFLIMRKPDTSSGI